MSADVTPGYKQTEIGVIPDDWSVCELGDLAPYVTSGSRGWAEYYSDRGDPFVRITNLSRSTIYIDQADLKFVQIPDGDSEGQRTALIDGDLLISITADIGIIGYVDSSLPKPAYINQHIALVRFKSQDVDSKYLSYFLAGEATQRLFRSSTDQGAKAGMNLAGIGAIKAVLPPLIEQHSISKALFEMDALLSSLDQLIAKKRNIQQAAMQQLLTGQCRLPGFSGGWEVKRLGDLVSRMANGCVYTSDEKNGVPITRIETISGGTINWERIGYAKPSPEIELYKIQCGDILYSHINSIDHIGKVARYSDCKPLYHGMNLILLRPTSNVDSNFLFFLLSSEAIRRTARTLAKQAVSQASINTKELRALELTIPDVAEQTAIASILSDMDAELAALEFRRDKARQLKQGMTQELLTGRTRLISE